MGNFAEKNDRNGPNKLTSPTKINTYEVKASSDDPKYLVESEKGGARAAHKPIVLKKV